MEVTALDFSRLWCTNMDWAGIDWEAQGHRFETLEDEEIDFTFKKAYWVGKEYPSVIFSKMFLTKQGFKFQVLWDMCYADGQWVILTNYSKKA
jgi:hypothetical protein